MRILIVEDDNFKLDAIRVVVAGAFDVPLIATAKSLHDAMTALEDSIFDFVVLDMAIPSHTSDAGAIDTYSQPVGGLDVLLFLASQARPEAVAILTQYPTIEYDRRHVPLKELAQVLRGDGIPNIRAVVLFSETGEWKPALLAAFGGDK